ncbi:MAG TPA: hypothetical protein VHR46_09405 [Gaiella sp.]|jgi:hypothetical protein|nr:hypothetical protein [Gaiella sp.]
MSPPFAALNRTIAILAVFAAMFAGFASVARADDWGREDVAARAQASLDPAIRTAIAARNLDASPAAAVELATPVAEEGFAWGAAALGLGVGIAAMCALITCVTLVRQDGRLRNA